ncbi:MAG: DUF3267 domain-containing protein [Alkalispirochaeta sp.]
MPNARETLPDTYNPQSMVDVRNDARTRRSVFFLRLFSIVFFVPLFAGVPLTVRHRAGFDPVLLWEIGFGNTGWLVPFVLLGAAVYVVVLLHEGIHAGVLSLLGVRPVTVGFNGLTPVASAPERYLSRRGAFIYGATPFFAGSIVGIAALLVVPDRFVSWAFLPTVAHGVICAADFVVIAWLIGVPKDGVIELRPEGVVAYAEGPGAERVQRKYSRTRNNRKGRRSS